MNENQKTCTDKELQFRNKLISILSHDMKGLLANVYWMIEALENGMDSPEILSEMITELKSSADKNTALFNETYNWIKLQQNTFVLNEKAINVLELYQNLVSYFSARLSAKNLTLTFLGNADSILYTGKELLGFILKYFLQEAIDFSDNGKNIIFKVATSGNICVAINFNVSKNEQPTRLLQKYNDDIFSKQGEDAQLRYIKDFVNCLRASIEIVKINETEIELRLILNKQNHLL
ncbi:MAG: hypothetical protein PW786_07265 [Arachidicoccus sp.]|nr:hypothetical protein [Arachidicoccus sp.]